MRPPVSRPCTWNAVSAFANCGHAVAHVRGSYVPPKPDSLVIEDEVRRVSWFVCSDKCLLMHLFTELTCRLKIALSPAAVLSIILHGLRAVCHRLRSATGLWHPLAWPAQSLAAINKYLAAASVSVNVLPLRRGWFFKLTRRK